jgi:hypothetical protein
MINVEKLGALMMEHKAVIILEETQELVEVCDALENYVSYEIGEVCKYELLENGLPVSLFGFAMSCLRDEPPYRYLGIDDEGDINAWMNIADIYQGMEPEYVVKISDVYIDTSAKDELNNLIGAF